jgi:RHS repeat-associated protein
VVEVSREYSVDNLDVKPGNESIETRTIHADPSPLDRIVEIGTDSRGRVVAIDEVVSGGGLTVLERDAKGRIVTVDGPNITLDQLAGGGGGGVDLNDLSIAYNYVDQRTSLSGLWPGGTGWTYQYDLNGNLYEQTSPNGNTIRFHWDELNRLAGKDYAPVGHLNPAKDIIYSYDTAENGIGRLASVSNPGRTAVDTSYSYTKEGQIAAMVRDFGSEGAFPFSYTYDLLGRPTLTVLPNGKPILNTYSGSVLEKIRRRAGWNRRQQSWFWVRVADNVQLHPSGGIATIDYPLVSGGSTYTYDLTTHRLATVQGTANVGALSGTIQSLDFTYDRAGNLTATDTTGSLTQYHQSFTYDGLHRLWSATCVSCDRPHGYEPRWYSYDLAGNLKTKGDLALKYEGSAVGASPHAVTRVEEAGDLEKGVYAYDADGGLVTRTRNGVTLNLTRDDDGRITDLSGGAGASYIYDEAGRRSRKTVAGGAGTLYVDPTYEVDLAGAGAPTHRIHFFHGSRRIATEQRTGAGLPTDPGSTHSWQVYFPDFVGSNSLVVTDTGEVQESFFRPFGEFAQSGGGLSEYLFTDQENDPESGLQYFGARYYDPWVGRFLSQDPGLIGSVAGISFDRIGSDPQQFNVYNYGRNAPTVYVDPTGEAAVVAACAASPACRGAVLGAIGFGVGTAVNAAAQYIATGEVNFRDALAAGAAAGAVSTAIGVNPGLAKPGALAALGGTAGAAGSVAGDAMNDREVSGSKAVVSGVAGAVATPLGSAVGNATENIFGASASSVIGEVVGASAGEGTALAISAAAPAVAEAAHDAGEATAERVRGAERDVQPEHQTLHDRGSITCTKTGC